jgi:hypothetical protein
VASYSGNGIAVTPERQFQPEEFGPTRIDERHRIVASGIVDLPIGFQVSSIVQFASPRPYSLNAGFDVDGDGLTTIDRICEGVDPRAVFDARGNSAAIRALNVRGCQQQKVNSQRSCPHGHSALLARVLVTAAAILHRRTARISSMVERRERTGG